MHVESPAAGGGAAKHMKNAVLASCLSIETNHKTGRSQEPVGVKRDACVGIQHPVQQRTAALPRPPPAVSKHTHNHTHTKNRKATTEMSPIEDGRARALSY